MILLPHCWCFSLFPSSPFLYLYVRLGCVWLFFYKNRITLYLLLFTSFFQDTEESSVTFVMTAFYPVLQTNHNWSRALLLNMCLGLSDCPTPEETVHTRGTAFPPPAGALLRAFTSGSLQVSAPVVPHSVADRELLHTLPWSELRFDTDSRFSSPQFSTGLCSS